MKALCWVVAVYVCATLNTMAIAAESEPTGIYHNSAGKGPTDWAKYLADDAAGSVTAAGLLGISGDVVTNVENLRDVVVSFKGLRTDEGKGTLGISVTPAMTAFSPVSLANYRDHSWIRFLSSTTLSYAQGSADIDDAEYDRQAVAAQLSYVFRSADDPIIAFDKAARGDPDAITVCKIKAAVDLENMKEEGKDDEVAFNKKLNEAVAECDKNVKAALRWNRSGASIAYGHGWIKPKSGGKQGNLGNTVAVTGTYGFEQFDSLENKAAITAIWRLSSDEPVLESLATDAIVRKDRSLLVGRLTFGSEKLRALIEVSDAKSDDITASQRTFKKALGVDLRLLEGTWINFRVGRQRNIEGTDDETASVVSVSYSPSALLK